MKLNEELEKRILAKTEEKFIEKVSSMIADKTFSENNDRIEKYSAEQCLKLGARFKSEMPL